MKILVATDKPFAAVAVEGIRKEIENAGMKLVLLEKYGEKAKLIDVVKRRRGSHRSQRHHRRRSIGTPQKT